MLERKREREVEGRGGEEEEMRKGRGRKVTALYFFPGLFKENQWPTPSHFLKFDD